MSELVVGSIAGLAANSYEIDISSGSTLDLSRAKAASLPTTALGAGSILQVQSVNVTTDFTSGSSSFVDMTGYSISFTPKSSTSRIYIAFSLEWNSGAVNTTFEAQIVRDSTALFEPRANFIPTATGRGLCAGYFDEAASSTSARTYKLQGKYNQTGNWTVFNGSLIVTEVAA